MEYNFGEKVEHLLLEKGSTKKSLYDHLGMTANGLDAMIKNNSMSATRLAQIANYFGVNVNYFFGIEEEISQKNENQYPFGEQVFQKLYADINDLKSIFEEQLKAKDKQIDGLQRTVDVLVGKSEGDTLMPLLSGDPLFDKMIQEYRAAGLGLSTLASKPVKLGKQEQKLVAPRSQSVRTRQ